MCFSWFTCICEIHPRWMLRSSSFIFTAVYCFLLWLSYNLFIQSSGYAFFPSLFLGWWKEGFTEVMPWTLLYGSWFTHVSISLRLLLGSGIARPGVRTCSTWQDIIEFVSNAIAPFYALLAFGGVPCIPLPQQHLVVCDFSGFWWV